MSEYPASLGDVADVEARLDARLTRLEKRQAADAEVTDEKIHDIRTVLAKDMDWKDAASKGLIDLDARVQELERLWRVALENPELVRELAAQALKGRESG